MATAVVLSSSDEESVRAQLEQYGIEADAVIVDPSSFCDSLTRLDAFDLGAVDIARMPNIPVGASALIDVDTTLFVFGNGISEFKNYILSTFNVESLSVFTNLCNLVNVWRRLGFRTIASSKVAPNVYHVVFKLR